MKDYFAERSECQLCLETGFMIISVDEQKVLICCGCRFGDEAHQTYGVKQWNFIEHKSYRTEPLEAKWFHPQPGEDKLWQWQRMVTHAKEFWRGKDNQLEGVL